MKSKSSKNSIILPVSLTWLICFYFLGSFSGGYDQYYGDSGRHPETPPYNIEQILNSPTNEAIKNLPDHKALSVEIIQTFRKKLDISKCRNDTYKPFIKCTGFCLFDLKNDPCETVNLIDDASTKDIVEDLKKKLQMYWAEVVPQTNKPIDLRSDPTLCNNTWFTWLDSDDNCILYWMLQQFKKY